MGNIGEIKVPTVVGNDIVTVGRLCTLVLKHIFKIWGRACDSSQHMCLVERKYLYQRCHLLQGIVFFFLATPFNDVSHISEGKRRSIQHSLSRETKRKDLFCSISSFPIVNIVNQDVRVKKYSPHLLIIYAKRSSLAISSSVMATMPRSFLNESGTCRTDMTLLFPEGMSSRIVSTRKATTINFSSRLIPSMRPMYGPKGVDFSFIAFAVIILHYLILDCKGKKFSSDKRTKHLF